jgi:hypothetical protein
MALELREAMAKTVMISDGIGTQRPFVGDALS